MNVCFSSQESIRLRPIQLDCKILFTMLILAPVQKSERLEDELNGSACESNQIVRITESQSRRL